MRRKSGKVPRWGSGGGGRLSTWPRTGTATPTATTASQKSGRPTSAVTQAGHPCTPAGARVGNERAIAGEANTVEGRRRLFETSVAIAGTCVLALLDRGVPPLSTVTSSHSPSAAGSLSDAARVWPVERLVGRASALKVGMWIFLISDALTFGGLLLAYAVLRAGARQWWPSD